LNLYHQYSNARVMQASPIPTNMTMNTPPVTVNYVVRATLRNFHRSERNVKNFRFSTAWHRSRESSSLHIRNSQNLRSHIVIVLLDVTLRNIYRFYYVVLIKKANFTASHPKPWILTATAVTTWNFLFLSQSISSRFYRPYASRSTSFQFILLN
jgi:hypothetical protein